MTVTKCKATEGRMVHDFLVLYGEEVSVYIVQKKGNKGKIWKIGKCNERTKKKRMKNKDSHKVHQLYTYTRTGEDNFSIAGRVNKALIQVEWENYQIF